MDTLSIKALFSDLLVYESASIIAKLLESGSTVLIVGPSWGRDYFKLQETGKHIFCMDIAPQHHLSNLVVGDAESPLPFHHQSFDAVLAAEVLEHLFNDRQALLEMRRVLKDDGVLLVTIPYYNDTTPTHVRIHSPVTIRRLLESAGFKVSTDIRRGGLISFTSLVDLVSRIVVKLSRGVVNRHRVYQLIVAIDIWLGRRWPSLLSRSQYYGSYLQCRKGESVDFRDLNIERYSHRV